VLSVAWYRFRATFHRRWSGLLAVVVLVGLIGGLAMGAAAGARRSQSAFPGYLASTHASDLQVAIIVKSAAANTYSPAVTNELAHLRYVRRVGSFVNTFAAPLKANGAPKFPAALDNNTVEEIGSVNGEYFDTDRVAVTQGRMANPASVNEFVMTAQAARLLGWHVGEVIPLGVFTNQQSNLKAYGTPAVQPTFRISGRLVGIVVFNSQVVRDEVDQYPTLMLYTPAFTRHVLTIASFYTTYALTLDHGSRDVAAVEREIIDLLPRKAQYQFHVTSVVEAQTERATKPESIALGVFGLIAAFAALVIAGQAIARQLRSERDDLEILRALGAGTAMTTADGLPGMLAAIVLGALSAAGTAVALSPMTLIGPVRQLEPSPGVSFDWTVLGVGLGVLIVGLSAAAIAVAYRNRPRRATSRQRWSVSPASKLARAAAAGGMPAPAVIGIGFAIEGGRGRRAAPVRSALVGTVLAVAVVVSTLTFASGLRTLVSHPALYGWNWDYAIEEAGGGKFPAVGQDLLNRDPDVSAWTGFEFPSLEIDGQTIPALVVDTHAALTPPILSGHPLDGPNQIVLGASTIKQLHKRIGDTVTVGYGGPHSGPTNIPPTPLKIVGTATLPAVGIAAALHVSMGTGAIVPNSIETAAFKRVQAKPDPLQNGVRLAVVRLRSNVPAAVGLASLQRIAQIVTKRIDDDPNLGGGTFVVLPVQQPAEIVNYQTMGNTPALLAAALALGAVVALGLTLTASVRRRRRDLALLKTLGFTRRQLVTTVASQASVAAIIGTVIGVPAGIAIGRWLWTLFAQEIYAVARPTVPALAIIYVAVGALILANLVAVIPGLQAARTPSALLLHEE
jgi:hypothetical protein